jgi:hypothetical protein
MQTLDGLMTEIEEAATLPGVVKNDRLARLRDMRDELTEALDEVDTRIADVEALVEDADVDVTLAVSRLRATATIRDELIEAGTITEAEADEDGVFSHADLDAMEREGLLESAARELVTSGKLALDDPED